MIYIRNENIVWCIYDAIHDRNKAKKGKHEHKFPEDKQENALKKQLIIEEATKYIKSNEYLF